MENFDLLFDKMNEDYNYLQTIMGVVYEKIKENPSDEYSIELLELLGNLSKRMLSREFSFVASYCNRNDAIRLIGKIEERKNTLTTSLEKTTIKKTNK